MSSGGCEADKMVRPIPLATYRLQLTARFGFDEAAEVVPYLKELGITHVYASPFMRARKGSTHGYDIIDHNVLNPELGGAEAFERLSDALKASDLGLILDFVPNHMGVHFADNPWWLDVLEWGKASPYAPFFDIEWDILSYRGKGGILVPILGTSYGEALESGQIELRFDPDGSFSAWYFEHRLPIAPQRYSEILRTIVAAAGVNKTATGDRIHEIASLYAGLRRPDRSEAPVLKRQLLETADIRSVIDRGLDAYRAGAQSSSATQALHSLLERQHYKLAHWRLATSDINYRRFFDVNSLAGLRVEDNATFDSIHGLTKRLISAGQLQGLRIDHIDGLRDPAQYCRRLARLIAQARGHSFDPFYLLIEKILGEDEILPPFEGVHGTTGYEWLNAITQVLLDTRGLETLDEVWRQASNIPPDLAPILESSKRRVLETLLASEFTVLSRLLVRIAGGHYSTRDFSPDSLRQAFELYVVNFPVYRTYMTSAGPSSADRALISKTIEKARARWFSADEGIFDFLRDVLTMDLARTGRRAPGKPRIRRFALKVQQFTGPMMAKSLEDTAFYRFHRLLALNEVGGNAGSSGMPIASFHSLMIERSNSSPHGMNTTATHDTKRGEDARARLLALPELASEWAGLVGRWKELNARYITHREGSRSPSVAFEYMLYQALIGAWPEKVDADFTKRMQTYAVKAAREAKLETSWLNPNEPYERNLESFIAAILDATRSSAFLDSFESFSNRASLVGALNSLSQITLKTMMPGVPDFYQGTELWETSLVDPDNRRHVDFNARRSALEATHLPDWKNLTANWRDGRLKMAWTRQLLRLRARLPDLFTRGGYMAVPVEGPDKDHVLAFARCLDDHAVIVAVGRKFAGITEQGTVWPRRTFDAALNLSGYEIDSSMTALENGRLSISELFAHFPAATVNATVLRPGNGRKKAAREHGRTA